MARNGNESELEVFDSTGNGAETPGVDVTFLDKDGIETRERVEPENGIGFDASKRELKKKKFSVADAMKRSFVRENTSPACSIAHSSCAICRPFSAAVRFSRRAIARRLCRDRARLMLCRWMPSSFAIRS